MIDYYIVVVISYSIGIAAIIGLVRFRKIVKSYRPFILITTIAFLAEILTTIFSQLYQNPAVIGNVYILTECLLFTWLFKKWGAFAKRRNLFYLVIFLTIAIWVFDNFVLNPITRVNSLSRICFSFILLFLSINQINKLIVTERGNILKNASFLISIGIVFYYSFKATIEVFYFIELDMSMQFYKNVFDILVFVNLFVNLVYALATLWIPTKQKFTLPS